jgi:hypothetical protein
MPTFVRSVGVTGLAAAGEDGDPPHAGINAKSIAPIVRGSEYTKDCPRCTRHHPFLRARCFQIDGRTGEFLLADARSLERETRKSWIAGLLEDAGSDRGDHCPRLVTDGVRS